MAAKKYILTVARKAALKKARSAAHKMKGATSKQLDALAKARAARKKVSGVARKTAPKKYSAEWHEQQRLAEEQIFSRSRTPGQKLWGESAIKLKTLR